MRMRDGGSINANRHSNLFCCALFIYVMCIVKRVTIYI